MIKNEEKQRQEELEVLNDLLNNPANLEEIYDKMKQIDYLMSIDKGFMQTLLYIRRKTFVDGILITNMKEVSNECGITYQQAGRIFKTLENNNLLLKQDVSTWKVMAPLYKINQ